MLTNSQISSAKASGKPRKLFDVRGLYLKVMPSGGRNWRFNYRVNGKQKTLTLGSHLRRLAPLPKDELLALLHSIGELAAIGRNINQITRATNMGGQLPGTVRDEFRATLRICEALRDNTKVLLKANLASWECA
ncbi:MAG: integrase arm-type DNA-binding domain-containing protein [Steroidobacteraceae bacterium]